MPLDISAEFGNLAFVTCSNHRQSHEADFSCVSYPKGKVVRAPWSAVEIGLSAFRDRTPRVSRGLNGPLGRKHRMLRKSEPERTGELQGGLWITQPSDATNDALNGDVGRQGRAGSFTSFLNRQHSMGWFRYQAGR